MRTWAGSGSTVLFTHLSASSSNTLTGTLGEMSSGSNASSSLADFECHTEGIMGIVQKRYAGKIEKVCLLDPKADVELSVEDGDGKFEAFLFGVLICLAIRLVG
jgi:ribosome biogenesis SPOUT family RNA methylase Rps3